MNPVADVQPVPIDRQRLSAQGIGDEEWDELLRELIRPHVVSGARDLDAKPISAMVGKGNEVRSCLRGAIGAGGRKKIGLPEGAVVDAAVHLIRIAAECHRPSALHDKVLVSLTLRHQILPEYGSRCATCLSI